MPKQQPTYLGDGAFVEWNGYAFVIFTDNGLSRTNEVYLEPNHMRELIRYAQEIDARIRP